MTESFYKMMENSDDLIFKDMLEEEDVELEILNCSETEEVSNCQLVVGLVVSNKDVAIQLSNQFIEAERIDFARTSNCGGAVGKSGQVCDKIFCKNLHVMR